VITAPGAAVRVASAAPFQVAAAFESFAGSHPGSLQRRRSLPAQAADSVHPLPRAADGG
jgi:hypothetical protein